MGRAYSWDEGCSEGLPRVVALRPEVLYGQWKATPDLGDIYPITVVGG